MKLPEERSLNLSATMVISMVTLEDFVHALEQESPEAVKRSIVPHKTGSMNGIVVVGFDY